MQYAPSRNRQWYIYNATEGKTRTRRMFLRALIRQPKVNDESVGEDTRGITLVKDSITQSLQGALDELELAVHDTNGKADHIHLYLCILRAQELDDLRYHGQSFSKLCTYDISLVHSGGIKWV